MFEFGTDSYSIQCAVGELPSLYNEIVARVSLHDDFGIRGIDGESVFIAVSRAGEDWPFLALSLRCAIGSGFRPGAFLIPETDILLVGAEEQLLAYDLKSITRLWEDYTMCGFWCWRRHSDIVVMSAELEIAGYSLRGDRLWSRSVEPPWSYKVDGEGVRLDVMGKLSHFSLATGV